MAYTEWTINNTTIQGDLNLSLEKGRVYSEYVELHLLAFSSKWDSFNIALEYRRNADDSWKSDTKIIAADIDYIKGNRLFGLQSSSGGSLNKITWKYKDNYIKYGDVPELKIRILPTIKQFSEANGVELITKAYGENKADLIDYTSHYQILGVDNSGNYIATDNTRIRILTSLNPVAISREYDGVLSPLHAVQIYSGNYIIADTANNRVIETDSNLGSIVKTYAVSAPQFVNYSESNETLLITSRDPDTIYEISWSEDAAVLSLWTSTISLNDPSCATYSRNNQDQIIISDTGNNRIIIYDKLNDVYTTRTSCTFQPNDTTDGSTLDFYRPFRSYQLYDNQICIIEESGIELGFDFAESSSSSSIDSSSSSSSS